MSPEPDQPPEAQRLSDQDARNVLERAIQLDVARTSDTTIAELRRVAQELNISSSALTQALHELQNKNLVRATKAEPQAPLPPADPPKQKSWWRTVAIGAAGLIGGQLSLFEPVPDALRVSPVAVAVLAIASAYLLFHHRLKRTPSEYQSELLALWGGAAAGVMVALGEPNGPVALDFTFGWLVYSAVGGFLIRLRLPWGKREQPEPEVKAAAR